MSDVFLAITLNTGAQTADRAGQPYDEAANADRQLVYATSGGELADARGMGEDCIAACFQDLASKKLR